MKRCEMCDHQHEPYEHCYYCCNMRHGRDEMAKCWGNHSVEYSGTMAGWEIARDRKRWPRS